MRKMTETTRVVVDKTIVQQVIELPLNSVIKVEFDGFTYVLHRTGRNGWLATRNLNSRSAASNGFYKNDEIVCFIERIPDPKVVLLTD